ncbi:hypothetical protein DIPPA_13156 [Diplonema papillatum]|nr:hypothetical protein DIPPA_13156 [Diplonema papillatum]
MGCCLSQHDGEEMASFDDGVESDADRRQRGLLVPKRSDTHPAPSTGRPVSPATLHAFEEEEQARAAAEDELTTAAAGPHDANNGDNRSVLSHCEFYSCCSESMRGSMVSSARHSVAGGSMSGASGSGSGAAKSPGYTVRIDRLRPKPGGGPGQAPGWLVNNGVEEYGVKIYPSLVADPVRKQSEPSDAVYQVYGFHLKTGTKQESERVRPYNYFDVTVNGYKIPGRPEFEVFRQMSTGQKTPFCEADWKVAYEDKKGNITAWTRPPPSAPWLAPEAAVEKTKMHQVRVSADFNCPAEVLYNVLQDSSYRKVWDDRMIKGQKICDLTARSDISYYAANLPSPLSNREFCAVRCWGEFDDGYVIMSYSVTHPDCPETSACVRAHSYGGGYYVAQDEKEADKCTLYFLSHSDMKTTVPAWMINSKIGTMSCGVIPKLRDAAANYHLYLRFNSLTETIGPWRTPVIDWDAEDARFDDLVSSEKRARDDILKQYTVFITSKSPGHAGKPALNATGMTPQASSLRSSGAGSRLGTTVSPPRPRSSSQIESEAAAKGRRGSAGDPAAAMIPCDRKQSSLLGRMRSSAHAASKSDRRARCLLPHPTPTQPPCPKAPVLCWRRHCPCEATGDARCAHTRLRISIDFLHAPGR